jgi:hypothetical protein
MHDHDTAIREQTPVVAAPPHEPERAELPPAEEWLGDLSELPPRPRRRLLTPAPLALIVVLLLALGFIGGVLVEKGQSASSTAATGAATAARLRGFAAAGGAAGIPGGDAGAGAGAAGGAGGARPTSGTVAYVSGQTLYVTTGESTVQVKTSAATSVTKTVKSTVKSIHPGETVTVTGSKGTNGTLTAESIRVGSTGGLGGLFAGAGGKGASGSSAGAGSGGPALFGGG